jgi:hypothetical protein
MMKTQSEHDQSEATGGVSSRTPEPVQVAALPQPAKAETPVAGYAHSATVWISPRVFRWVAPVAVVALSVLLFLPWTGASPGGHRVYTQNAFQTIWGGVTIDPVGAEALGFVKPYDNVEGNRLMLFYVLLVLLALVLVLAPLWLAHDDVQALRPILRPLWRWRLQLLGAMALGASVLLGTQMGMGFGLETAAATRVDKNLAGELAAAKTPAEHEKAKIHRGLEMSAFSFGRTLWFYLAVFSQGLLLTGVALELWLERRGAQPLPRIDGHA